ncbi:MAG TPA: MASE1 domain-containing protein [Pyrinomonadaceae bacterium]|jgi:signal transduction histidine kinase|nr:MASE1 domain-containing protein [Pyrinomonadaceae bacterium]
MSQLVVGTAEPQRVSLITRYHHVLRSVLLAVTVSAAYFIGAKIGFALTFQPHPVSTLWPPNSILFAALLLTPVSSWWLVLLAVLPAHVLSQVNAGVPIPMMLCWYISNCTEGLIGASVLRYFTKQVRLDSSYHVGLFILVAVLGPFLSSFLDAGFVALNHFATSPYWDVFRMRVFSNVLASLTLVPLIVTWKGGGIRSLMGATSPRYVEAACLAAGLLIVGIISFGTRELVQNTTPASLYLPLPFLLWASIRFGPRGSSAALMSVSFFAIWGAINGRGPFTGATPEESAMSVQSFLIVAAMTLLFLTAVMRERDETSQRNRALLSANPDMVFLMSNQGVYLDYHARDRNNLLLSPELFLGKNVREVLPPQLAEDVVRCLERSNSTDEPQVIEYSLQMAQEERHYEARLIGMEGNKTMSIVRDVTDRERASRALQDSQQKLHQSHTQVRSLLGRLIDIQEAERRRISRELHDDLSQKIATLSVSISRLKRQLPLANSELITELDDLRHKTNSLTNEVRRLSHQLHPAVLEHLGLVTALESYIGNFKEEEQIDVRLNAEIGDERVPFQTSICIYRVAVEALRNVSRHSGAASAAITLKRDNGSLELRVSDSGKGFDVDGFRRGGGLGLVSIEERLRLLQGSCEIHSTPEKGTTLVARVPLTN